LECRRQKEDGRKSGGKRKRKMRDEVKEDKDERGGEGEGSRRRRRRRRRRRKGLEEVGEGRGGRRRQWEREEYEKKEGAFARENTSYLKMSQIIKKETIISEERNTAIITSIQSYTMTTAYFSFSQLDLVQRHSLFLYLVQLHFFHSHLSLSLSLPLSHSLITYLQDIHMT
jgi:hypothetical protein